MSLKSKYDIFKRFNVETLYNTFLGLQPRQQIIALVVTGLVLLLIIIMPLSLAAGKLSSMQSTVTTGKDKIDDVVREIAELNSERSKLKRVESMIGGGFDTSISTTLENVASTAGIQDSIVSLKERPLIPSDIYDEASVDVRISKVTLPQIVDFLYSIENDKSRVLRVKQLQMKPRYDNKKLMDVSFRVSTFRLSGEGEQ